jgi:hypothetical protein
MSDLVKRLRTGASISRDRNINLDYAKVADEAADRIEELERELADAHGIGQACEQWAERLKAENAALTAALKDTVECIDGCMVFITSREKINSNYGESWIADMTKNARAAIAAARSNRD